MGLSGSMWTGVSGLLVHGEKMNVVGHNIANVNTIGFKSQRMDFQDMFYNNTFSAGGLEQIGMGARVGMVLNDFSQGPFEQTGLSTDLAIQGKGWFQVRVPGQDTVFYTRAGDFSFNKQGELKNPQGYILQGWEVPRETGPSIGMGVTPAGAITRSVIGAGVPKDITLDTWTVSPLQTSNITMYANLSAYETDHCRWESNPFAAMFNTWNGQLLDPLTNEPLERNNQPYMPETAFAYSSPIKIYDEAGVAHTATVYYDKVEKDDKTKGFTYYDGGKPSETVWEYIVTIDPAEDNRMYCPTDAAGNLGAPVSIQNTRMAGILMSGTLTFNGGGTLIDQSAYTLQGGKQAVTLDTTSGNATLQEGYVAVWTDPNNPAVSYTYTYPNDTLIPAERMSNTAFYPIMNTSAWGAPPTALPGTPPGAPVGATPPAGIAAAPTTHYTTNAAGDYVVNPTFQISVDGVLYKPGATIPKADLDGAATLLAYDAATTAAMDAIVTQNAAGDFVVNTGHQVIGGTPAALYNAGAVVPKAVWLAATPPAVYTTTALAYATADTAPATATMVVMPGYQVNGNPPGTVIPAPTAAAPPAILQNIGAQNAMMSWYPTAVSNNGLPVMVANFTSQEQAMTVGSPKGSDYLIEMDFGLKIANLSRPWANELPLGTPRTALGPFAPDSMNIDPYDTDTWANYAGLAGINGEPVHQPEETKLVGAQSSSTQVSRQNGYTYGNLMDINVDQYGILSGIYSNGVTLPLYQIVLYDFVAPQHLRFEGGNLVSQTRESGDPSWGAAGTAGFGTVQSYTIEQSNVDLAKEMVHMITTQRGFQANSKVVTTTDTMLEVVVNMKR